MTLQPKPEQCIECGKVFTWADEMASDAVRKGGTTREMCKKCRNLHWLKIKKQFEKKID